MAYLQFNNKHVFSYKDGKINSFDSLGKWKYSNQSGEGLGPCDSGTMLGGQELVTTLLVTINSVEQILLIGKHGAIASYDGEWKNYLGQGLGDGFYYNLNIFSEINCAVVYNNYVVFGTNEGEVFSLNLTTQEFEYANSTGLGNGPCNNKTALRYQPIYAMLVAYESLIVCCGRGYIASYNNSGWRNYDGSGNTALLFHNGSIITSDITSVYYDQSDNKIYFATSNGQIAIFNGTNISILNDGSAIGNVKINAITKYNNKIVFAGENGRVAYYDLTTTTFYVYNSLVDTLSLINDGTVAKYYEIIDLFPINIYGMQTIAALTAEGIGIVYNTYINKWVYNFMYPPKRIEFSSLKINSFSEYIDFQWFIPATSQYHEMVEFYYVELNKNGNKKLYIVKENNFKYYFDRDSDGYPEAEDLFEWTIKIKTANFNNVPYSNYEVEQEINILSDTEIDKIIQYGTWDANEVILDNIIPGSSGRNAVVVWDKPAKGQRALNGEYYYELQIAKKSDGVWSSWYSPTISLNEYDSEYNWFEGQMNETYKCYTEKFTQTLPLTGQDSANPQNTEYRYRIKVTSLQPTSTLPTNTISNTWSLDNSAEITARPVSARDVVTAKLNGQPNPEALTAENIYVENLAAISANLGVISDGDAPPLPGNGGISSYNYWILDNQPEGYERGRFRIGTANQKLEFNPYAQTEEPFFELSTSNGLIGEDKIESYLKLRGDGNMDIKLGVLNLDANNSFINSNFTTKGDFITEGFFSNSVMIADPDNLEAGSESRIDGTQKDGSRKYVFISNTNSAAERRANKLDVGYAVNSSGKIFHFDTGDNLLDHNGQSYWTLTGTASYDSDDSIIVTQLPFIETNQQSLFLQGGYLKSTNAIANTMHSKSWLWEGWIKTNEFSTDLLTVCSNNTGVITSTEYKIKIVLVSRSSIYGSKTGSSAVYEYGSKTGSSAVYEYSSSTPEPAGVSLQLFQGNDSATTWIGSSSDWHTSSILDGFNGWNHIAIGHNNTTDKIHFIINQYDVIATPNFQISGAIDNLHCIIGQSGKNIKCEEFALLLDSDVSDFTALVPLIKERAEYKIPFANLDFKKPQFIIDSKEPVYVHDLTATGDIHANRVYNAVWNDIVDFLEVEDDLKIEFGYAYYYDGKKHLKTQQYAQQGVLGIASDTFGFGVGKKEGKNALPIAIGGIVLAYVDKVYPSGTALTCSKDGILTKASLFTKIFNPEKIIAHFYKIEKQDKWNDIQVNNRNWVKII